MNKFFFIALVSVCISAAAMAEKLKVVASFSILGDIVRNVGAEHIEVIDIVGPNSDAHIFHPTPLTAQQIAEADVIFINGLGFEGWIERLIEASGFKGPVVTVTKGITAKTFADSNQSYNIVNDPHAWHSIANIKIYVKNITKALQEFDASHALDYQQHAERYLAQLDDLEEWVQRAFQQVPLAKRKAITAHDAFQYFGHEYGITFLAPVGVSTVSEPSAHEVVKLIEQIKRESIKAVFVENIANSRLINQIAKEAKVDVSGVLYSDALSEPSGPAANYISMMRHNVSTLVKVMTEK